VKYTSDRGKVESKSASFFDDQMDFIESQLEETGLNFPQYLRGLVDIEMDLKGWVFNAIAKLKKQLLSEGLKRTNKRTV